MAPLPVPPSLCLLLDFHQEVKGEGSGKGGGSIFSFSLHSSSTGMSAKMPRSCQKEKEKKKNLQTWSSGCLVATANVYQARHLPDAELGQAVFLQWLTGSSWNAVGFPFYR